MDKSKDGSKKRPPSRVLKNQYSENISKFPSKTPLVGVFKPVNSL